MEFFIDILENQNLSTFEINNIEQTFVLLTMLPVIATIVGISRHIIGLKNMSLYVPILLTYSFYELGYIESDQRSNLFRGLEFGLAMYLLVFLSSTFIYSFLKRFRIHYIPKSTMVLIGVSIVMITSITLGTALFDKKGLIYVDLFSVIMIAMLSDSFVTLLARKDMRYTIKVSVQTLFTSVICYSIISANKTEELVLNYGLIIIVILMLVNIYIGKFVGLRLTEYIRFKDILLDKNDDWNNHNNSKKQKNNTRSK